MTTNAAPAESFSISYPTALRTEELLRCDGIGLIPATESVVVVKGSREAMEALLNAVESSLESAPAFYDADERDLRALRVLRTKLAAIVGE